MIYKKLSKFLGLQKKEPSILDPSVDKYENIFRLADEVMSLSEHVYKLEYECKKNKSLIEDLSRSLTQTQTEIIMDNLTKK